MIRLSGIKVFHFPLSRSARVLWMLEELGLAYEVIKVDLVKGEAYTPVSAIFVLKLAWLINLMRCGQKQFADCVFICLGVCEA